MSPPVARRLVPWPAIVVALVALASVSARQTQPAPLVTFTHDIAPVVFAHCVPCHRPGSYAPFALLTYADARQRSTLLASATSNGYMPPWQPRGDRDQFAGDRRLTPDQIALFQRWAEEGAPEGDPGDLPPTPDVSSGWQLGPPDLVVSIDRPFEMSAGGPDVFRNFVVSVPVTSRRYVRAMEFRPGNARVIHHARILLDDTGDSRQRDAESEEPGFPGMDAPGAHFPDGHFLGWASGKMADREAYPWPLDPGTDLVVQMHLKPTGKPTPVQASIGFYFTDTPPSATPVMLRLGSKTIDIPPEDADYTITDTYVLPVDVVALSIYPHAHYLGKQMRVTARERNGATHILLDIPNWDFNWQDEYEFAKPLDLPAGTTISMLFRYDNSAANAHNPHSPPERVLFGPSAADEMGELLLQLLPKREADLAKLRAAISRKALEADVAGEEKRIADVPGDANTRNALGVAYIQLGRLDAAVKQFREAIRLAPNLAVAHYNLGVIAMARQQTAEAMAEFGKALSTRPDYVQAHTNLGVVLTATGREREAINHFRQALAAKPTHTAALTDLAWLLSTSPDSAIRRPTEAVSLAERAARLTNRQSAPVLDTLGAAYAASGDFAAARNAANEALSLAVSGGNSDRAEAIRRRLALYRAGKPFIAAAATSAP